MKEIDGIVMGKIEILKGEFDGIGEMKGFKFQFLSIGSGKYMYKVTSSEGNVHYEVFNIKTVPICIDFEKRIYSETDFKEVYPKAKDFGIWAWTFRDIEKAAEKMKS